MDSQNKTSPQQTGPLLRRNGKAIDLRGLFERINGTYFGNEVTLKDVVWGIPDMIHQNGISCVPAAAIYPNRSLIVVHEALPRFRAPKYVYMYLLFHECLHQIVPPEDGDCHGPVFRKREMFAPNRKRSIDWLRRKNFPVMDDE